MLGGNLGSLLYGDVSVSMGFEGGSLALITCAFVLNCTYYSFMTMNIPETTYKYELK